MEQKALYSTDSAREVAREKLIGYIAGMDLARENRLPSENNLCEILGVSRVTVRSILEEMNAEGRIVRTPANRHAVNPEYHRMKATLNPYQTIEEAIRANGHTPRSRNLRTTLVAADEKLASALKIEPGAGVLRSRYLFYADEHFCALCDDFIDGAILHKSDRVRFDTETSALYLILYERTGRRPLWDLSELSVSDTLGVPALAEHSGVPEGQVKSYLLLESMTFDTHSRPLLFSQIHYDPEHFRFGIVRKLRMNYEDFHNEEYKGNYQL